MIGQLLPSLDRPLLVAAENDVVFFRDHALEFDALARILLRHPLEVIDERFLSVTDLGIVLDVGIANVQLDRSSRSALV